MIDWLNAFLSNHHELIGVALFLIALLECLAIVGLFIPGITLLFVAALFAGQAGFPLWAALLLVFLGGFIGDLLSYAIGYKLKDKVFQFTILNKNIKWVNMAEDYFQRYGGMGLLIGRFISPMRPIMPMLAGLFNLSFIKCLFVSFLASVAWSISLVMPSWITGAAFALPIGRQFWLELTAVMATLAILLTIGIHGCLKQQRWITLYMASVCFILLTVLYFLLPHLQVLDNGLLLITKEVKSSELDAVVSYITELGGYKVQFVISAVLCFLLLFMRQLKALLFFAFTMLLTATVGWIIKETVDRVRPQSLTDIMHTYSFPSGHTSASFAFFISLGILAGLERSPKTRLLWLFIASLPAIFIALSRVYLGVHWVTDVVAGGLLAAGICMSVLTWIAYHGKIPALPQQCWKVLLAIGLLVFIVASIISFIYSQ